MASVRLQGKLEATPSCHQETLKSAERIQICFNDMQERSLGEGQVHFTRAFKSVE